MAHDQLPDEVPLDPRADSAAVARGRASENNTRLAGLTARAEAARLDALEPRYRPMMEVAVHTGLRWSAQPDEHRPSPEHPSRDDCVELSGPPQAEAVIVLRGGGAGLDAAMTLAGHNEGRVAIVDQPSTNHHRFQPATDQVTTDGLSPADIAVRIRGFNKGR